MFNPTCAQCVITCEQTWDGVEWGVMQYSCGLIQSEVGMAREGGGGCLPLEGTFGEKCF